MIKKVFQDLCSNIEISRSSISTISGYKKEITSIIDEYFC